MCHQHSESDTHLVIVKESIHCPVVHNLPRQQDMFNCGLFSVAFAMGFNSSEDSLEENSMLNINPDIQSLYCGSICNFQVIRSLNTSRNIQLFRARLTMLLSEPLFKFCFPCNMVVKTGVLPKRQDQNGVTSKNFSLESGTSHENKVTQSGFTLVGSSDYHTDGSKSTQISMDKNQFSNNVPRNRNLNLPCPTTPTFFNRVYPNSIETKVGIEMEENNELYLDSNKYYEVHEEVVDDIEKSAESSSISESGDCDNFVDLWMDDVEDTSPMEMEPVHDVHYVINNVTGSPDDNNRGTVPICIENFEKITAIAMAKIDTSQHGMSKRHTNQTDKSFCNNSILKSEDIFGLSRNYYDEFKESLQDVSIGYQDIIYPSSMDSDDSEFKLDWKSTLQTPSIDSYLSDSITTSCDDVHSINAESDSSDSVVLTFDEIYTAEKLREQFYQEEKQKKLEKELKSDPSFKPSDHSNTISSTGSYDDDETSTSSPDVSFSFTEEDPTWRKSSLRELKAIHEQDCNCISFTNYITLLLETHPTLTKMATDCFIKEFEVEMDTLKKTVGKKKSIFSKQSWHQLPKAIKGYLEAASIMLSGDKKLLQNVFVDMTISSSNTTNPNIMGKGFNGTSIDIDSIRSMDHHLGNAIPAGGSSIIMSGKIISTLKKELPKSISYKIWDNKEKRGFKELKEVPHFQLMTSRNHKSKIFLCLPNLDSSETCSKSFVLKENFRKKIMDTLIIPSISAMNTPNERINFFSSTRIAMEKSRNEKGQLGNTHIDLSNNGVQQLSKRIQDIIATTDDVFIQQAFDFFFLYQIDDIKQFTRVYLTEMQPTSTNISNMKTTDKQKPLPLSSHMLAKYTYENGDTLYSEFVKLSDLRPSKLDTVYRLDVG